MTGEGNGNNNGNGDKKWERRKRQILFFAGLIGAFCYVIVVTMFHEPFRIEFFLGFFAMMGVSIAQGVDRK